MPGLGSLTVYLNANSGGLERGIARASSMLKKFAAASAGYMAVSGLKQLAEESLNLAGAQQKAENLMARTLQNTAGMADTTVADLKRYASEAQQISIFGDEKVLEAQTRLMQMNSVTGDAFRQTRAVALDIASATGQDLTLVMQTLGKAMQDPVKGIRQLREYGTDPALKDQIEQVVAAEGREAAQLILLTDLQKRYQGAAEEAADTIAGAFAQNRNAVGDLKESFGFLLNEVFGVQDMLKTSADWFGSWAKYLRDKAPEIGYAFRSVWNDIKFGAQKLYLFVAPVINQISSIAEAAARNIIEFYQAIPRLLNGEEFTMKFYEPAYNLFEEYKQLDKMLDQLSREQAAKQSAIDREFSLQLSEQAQENLVRGAAAGTEKGMENAVKKQQKQKFDNPAAVEGSQDAWKIIAAAMQWKPGTASPSTASAPVRSDSSSPAWPLRFPGLDAGDSPSAPAKPAAASPEAKRISPISPIGPASQTSVKFFDPQIRQTEIRSTDIFKDFWANLNVIASFGQKQLELEKRFNPQRGAELDRLLSFAEMQNPSGWLSAGMVRNMVALDSRNNGTKYTRGELIAPISQEQVQAERERLKLQREQLAAQKETNRELKKFSLNPSNLFGGWF